MPRYRILPRSFVSAAALGAALALSACGGSSALPDMSVSETSETLKFDEMMSELALSVEARAAAGIPVPVPVDGGGGYNHEQHKQNAKKIYEAGMM